MKLSSFLFRTDRRSGGGGGGGAGAAGSTDDGGSGRVPSFCPPPRRDRSKSLCVTSMPLIRVEACRDDGSFGLGSSQHGGSSSNHHTDDEEEATSPVKPMPPQQLSKRRTSMAV